MTGVRRNLGRARAATVWIVLAGLPLTPVLVSCTQDTEPEPVQPVSVTEAGERYLEIVCPVNDAWNEADRLVDDMRSALVIEPDDIGARYHLLAEALRSLASVSNTAANELEAQGEKMPEEVRGPVEDMVGSLRRDAEQAERVAELDPRSIVNYSWEGIGDTAEAVRELRASLGLDDDDAPSCANVGR